MSARPQRARRSAHGPGSPAVLVPLSYGPVLLALQHADVQVVAAARSTSIRAAAALGCWLLDEPRTPRRAAGAAILTAGVAVSALGG